MDYKPPESFRFIIPSEELSLLYDVTKDDFPSSSYPMVVDKYLNMQQKCCALKSSHKPLILRSGSPFATIQGRCGCGLKFVIRIETKPIPGQDVVCHVGSSGKFTLIQENPVGRPLKGHARDIARQEMQHVAPSRVHLESLRSTNMYRALHNNFPQLSSSVLRLLHAEAKNIGTSEKDPFKDIHSFNEELVKKDLDKKLPGFVQKFDALADNLSIQMYSQEALRLLHFFQLREEVVLHIDATGSVVSQKGLTNRKCLLYLLLAKTAQFTFPISEALSQRGTTIDISEMFQRIKHHSKRLYPQGKRLVGVFVCDFSFAMIHGMLEGLNKMTLEDYLKYSFQILHKKELRFHPERSVLFVCTAHLIHAFANLIDKHIDRRFREMAISSLAKLQESFDLESYAQTISNICKLFDCEHLEEIEIDYLKQQLSKHSFDTQTVSIEDTVEEILDLYDKTFYITLRAKSPFYTLFVNERKKISETVLTSSTQNPYFCSKVNFLSLFATMMLKKSGRHDKCRVTNARIEGQFNFLKNKFHGGSAKGLNVFVRENFIYHEGMIAKVMEEAMQSSDSKRGRKRKKGIKSATTTFSTKTDDLGETENVSSGQRSKRRKIVTSSHAAKENWSTSRRKYAEPRYFSNDKKLSANRFNSSKKPENTPNGLVNLGRTCYFNSLMQAVLAIPIAKSEELPWSMTVMRNFLYNSASPPTSEEMEKVVSLLESVYGVPIPIHADQDAHELFSTLILHKSVGLEHLFYFMREETLSCKCGASSSRFEDSYYKTAGAGNIDIEGNMLVTPHQQAVEANCDICGSESKTLAETNLSSPRILVLLERLFSEHQDGKRESNLLRKQLPRRAVFETTFGRDLYRIASVITHIGPSIDTGHYVAYILLDGSWVRCDDSNVTVLSSEPDLANEDVYLSFYVKN